MTVKYELTVEDYLDFNIYHVMNSKTAQKSLLIQRILMAVIFLVFPLILKMIAEINLKVWFPICLGLAVLSFFLYPLYFTWLIKRNIVKIIAEGCPAGLIGRHKISLTEEEIIEKTDTGENRTYWSGIQSVQQNKRSIFIYINSMSAYIIPLRAFNDERKRDEFINTVRQNIMQ